MGGGVGVLVRASDQVIAIHTAKQEAGTGGRGWEGVVLVRAPACRSQLKARGGGGVGDSVPGTMLYLPPKTVVGLFVSWQTGRAQLDPMAIVMITVTSNRPTAARACLLDRL